MNKEELVKKNELLEAFQDSLTGESPNRDPLIRYWKEVINNRRQKRVKG